MSDTNPFIIDNSQAEWTVNSLLLCWCGHAKGIDVASAYFDIGALLALKDEWQKLDELRILMGEEVSLRTKAAFDTALARITSVLDNSLEQEKKRNDFLAGVDAVVDALRSGRIKCRVYRKEKFHAKAYIARGGADAHALAGSSNFTIAGTTVNVELNVQHAGEQAAQLADWFQKHWSDAEDVTPEILRVVERHVRLYSPFEIYAKSLHEMYSDRDMTTSNDTAAGPAPSSQTDSRRMAVRLERREEPAAVPAVWAGAEEKAEG